MRLRNFLHNILPWFQTRFGGVFQIVEIVDLSRRMILWHVEAVVVDESGLDERPHRLFEPERDEFPLDHSQESQVRMIFSRIERRDWGRYVVCSEVDPLPVSRVNHLACSTADFIDRSLSGNRVQPLRSNP